MQAPGPAAQGPQFEVISLNMHKGVSALHLRLTAHRLRQRIRDRHPDLVFLQELQQKTHGRLRDLRVGATLGLTPSLAQDFWPDWHYGRNALYDRGHHGNAILSRHPLSQGLNYDISEYRFERRGLLHAVAFIGERAVDCFCVHLGLLERGRRRQLEVVLDCIARIAGTGPAIVAGDFNDWRNRAEDPMGEAGFRDVFEIATGAPAKTFPSIRPMLRMDRIYVRGLNTHGAERLTEWSGLSDHLGLSARLSLPAA